MGVGALVVKVEWFGVYGFAFAGMVKEGKRGRVCEKWDNFGRYTHGAGALTIIFYPFLCHWL